MLKNQIKSPVLDRGISSKSIIMNNPSQTNKKSKNSINDPLAKSLFQTFDDSRR